MQGFPHRYHVSAQAAPETTVTLSGSGLPNLDTTPPPEFGGPEGSWSPETLLVASVADCFVLTFRAISGASKLDWLDLQVEAEGTLERVDNVTRFTRFDLKAKLILAEGMDAEKADKILHKSEAVCLITASLSSQVHLETDIVFG